MRYLAIIRHGEFTEGEAELNEEGRRQMRALVGRLKDLNPVVYSSLGPRSIESAHIIADGLAVSEPEAFEFFGSRAYSNEAEHYSAALSFLKNIDENVVIVTKGEWADDFVPYFAKEYLHENVAPVSLGRGEGVLVNCKDKTIKNLLELDA